MQPETATLSTGSLVEATGLKPDYIRTLADRKQVKPAEGGKGTGNPRRWSLMASVGFAVVAEYRKSFMGQQLRPKGVVAIVEAFDAQDVDWLEKEFKQGHTHFVHIHQGKPLLSGPQYPDWVNVQKCYEVVKKALEND
jgi:hypothetical protein